MNKVHKAVGGYFLAGVIACIFVAETKAATGWIFWIVQGLSWTGLAVISLAARNRNHEAVHSKKPTSDFFVFAVVFTTSTLGLVITRLQFLDAFPIDTDDWFFALAGHAINELGFGYLWEKIAHLLRGGIFASKIIPFCLYWSEQAFFSRDFAAWRLLDIAFLSTAASLLAVVARRFGLGLRASVAAGLLLAFSTASHEIVTYTSRMDYALEASLLLASLLALSEALRQPKKVLFYFLSLLLFLAALMTQEVAVLYPLVIVVFLPTLVPKRNRPSAKKLFLLLAPFAILSAAFLVVELSMLSPGSTTDLSGAPVDQRAMLVDWVMRGGPIWSFFFALPRFITLPFSPQAFGRYGLAATIAFQVLLAVVIWRSPHARRVKGPVVFAIAAMVFLSFGPTAFLADQPDPMLEQTRHYFYPWLFFSLLLASCLEPGKTRIAKVFSYSAIAVIISVNILAVVRGDPIRAWISKVMERTSYKVYEEVEKTPAGSTIFLATESVRLDRGIMDSVVLSVFMEQKPLVKINYISGIGRAHRPRAGDQFVDLDFTGTAKLMAWDPGENDFVRPDHAAFERLLDLQETWEEADCEECKLVRVKLPGGVSWIYADIVEDVWVISIVNRS